MVHYRLVILQCDGVTKVTSVKFEDRDIAEANAQLLARSAGIERVTIEECREYSTVYNRQLKGLLDALMG